MESGRILRIPQGSHEWFMARCGRVTASDVDKVMAFLKRGEKKGGDTEARAGYKATIVGEILTGEPNMDGYVTSFMSDGVENEPYARAAYEVSQDVSVDTVGFIIHPNIDRSGASPDGLVGNNGGVEVKCPKTKNHIAYMLAGELPEEYEPQVMFNIACAGREWWDFVSFDARLPLRHQLFIKRVYRNEHRIKEIEEGVMRFLDEVDATIAKLDRINPQVSLKEALQKSIDALDPALGIQEEDLPAWAREMRGTL